MARKMLELFTKKWVSALGLAAVAAIIAAAHFFQQTLEIYIGWGLLGLFTGCFLANATVLLPAPSLLLVCQFSLLYGPLISALVGGTGAALGEMLGYLAGRTGQGLVERNPPRRLVGMFQKNPYVVIFLFSVIPWPLFDVIGILSGAVRVKWNRFLAACWAGKLVKMLAYGLVVVKLMAERSELLRSLMGGCP